MNQVLINYFHYVGFAVLLAALVVELVLFRTRTDGATARKLAAADAFYGTAFLFVLGSGLLKLFVYDKPASYYGQNFLFHIKLTLFVVIFLISIYPTVKFFARRRTPPAETVEYPRIVGVLLRVEIALLLIIPLLAVLMARGYGMTG
jgi:putative membrane protein